MCWKHYGPHSRKEPSRQHEFIRLAKAFWVERQRLSDHIASLERAQNGRKGLEVGRGPFHNCLCVFVCVCHAAQKSPANEDTSVYAVQRYLHGAHGEGYSSLWPYTIHV